MASMSATEYSGAGRTGLWRHLYGGQERRYGHVRHGAARDALRQGKRVADSVKFYIQFGSQETREYCIRKGYLDTFEKAGAIA